METTIIFLSVISAALALLCLYLLLYVYLTNKMLESKDLMIMELQKRVNLENRLNTIREATRKMREFGNAIRSMGAIVDEKGNVIMPEK